MDGASIAGQLADLKFPRPEQAVLLEMSSPVGLQLHKKPGPGHPTTHEALAF